MAHRCVEALWAVVNPPFGAMSSEQHGRPLYICAARPTFITPRRAQVVHAAGVVWFCCGFIASQIWLTGRWVF